MAEGTNHIKLLPKIAAASVLTVVGASFLVSAAAQADPTKSREEWKKEYLRPAEIPFPEENPYTKAKADLGRTLFFEPRISGNNYISCTTFHNPSFA